MSYRKPKPIVIDDFAPWAVAHFQTGEIRDCFLEFVAATVPACDVEAEAMPKTDRGAFVRWRPGKFLNLNDIAYAHGGRIAIGGEVLHQASAE